MFCFLEEAITREGMVGAATLESHPCKSVEIDNPKKLGIPLLLKGAEEIHVF
jgi:hypothetical protein